MEKNSAVECKKTQDDSICSDRDVASGDGGEAKKEAAVDKSEKDDGVKNEGNPANQKKDKNSNSTTPKAPSRSTRSSNNPEFVAKQRHFLQKVNQGVFYQSSEEESDYSVTNGQSHASKRKRSVSGGVAHSDSGAVAKSTSSVDSGAGTTSSHTPSSSSVSGSKGSSAVKKRKYEVDELTRDIYCWVCHREMGISSGGSTLSCEVCTRVYHARCCHSIDPGSPYATSPSSSSNSNPPASTKKGWACPECVKIVRAETMGTRSRAMQLITMDQLCTLLKFVLTRVRAVTGAEPFYGAVDLQQFPRYREFVANPMDLGLIDRNIRRRTYGSTEAFFADMKWLVHNSIIFNTQHSKVTSIARSMLKICRQELMEIENCPDCYSNAHTRKDNWFIDVCRRPHILVWAKLKGFPHWPAKAMRVNKESCVDVRFFGAHDRAWVPARDCFLYSREMPAPPKNRKKNNFDGCIMEVEDHIKKLKDKYGSFVYSPLRTIYEPSQEDEILMKMLPKYQPINMDTPSGYVRESINVEQISRESPSMSTGTEEESDRDQSLEEESSSQKREYDTTFEDSLEVPSGCDVSQPSEHVATSDQSTENVSKVADETTSESEGLKGAENEAENNKESNETKDEAESKVTSMSEEDDTKEDRKEEEEIISDGVDNEKERKDTNKEGVKVSTKVEETEEKKVETEEVDVSSVDAPHGEGEIYSAGRKENKSKMEELLSVEAAEKKSVDEEAEEIGEGMKEKDVNNEKISDDAKACSDSAVPMKEESNNKPAEVNNEDKTGEKELKRKRTVAEVKDGVKVIGEEKEASTNPLSVSEENEVSAKPTLKKADNSAKMETDKSIKESRDEEVEVLEKSVTDTANEKENTHFEKTESSDVMECDEDSSGDKLASLNDQNNDSEISKIINSTYCEDGSSESLPSVSPAINQKASDNEQEKSCDKAENGAVERDGDESRAKLFQSLRLVNIETLYKQDVREALTKKGCLEVDKSKKDSAIGGVCGSKLEMPNKIDVNKLRESLMTKCANSAVTGGDLSHASDCANSKNNLSIAGGAKTSESKDDEQDKKDVDENMEIDGENASDKPAEDSVVGNSPASNKGDVGSQLRVLGKLQQRLSFIKETTSESDEESTQEKEDENTVEDADSVTGDASGTSNSDDEDSAPPVNHSIEAEKEVASVEKTNEKSADGAAEINVQEVKDVEVDDAKSSSEEEKKIGTCEEESEEKSEPVCGSEDNINEVDGLKKKGENEESEKVEMEVDQVDKCSLGSGTKTSDNESEKPSISVESVSKEGSSMPGRKSGSSKGKPPEMTDSGRASPMISKKQKLLEAIDEDSARSRASPQKAKSEEVIEEEVLNREVLKESNMVVVQKTVKTRRLDEEPSGGSAPKRARKGIAQKALIVDRSESPAHDEVFPSMFLDPSVTITVLQEAEKENGGSKEQSSSSTSVEELRTSVNLSNDVSLTMVHASGALEGLAAMQDGAVLRSSEQQEIDIVGHITQNSVSPLAIQFRPRARKSFPRPSPRLYARNPQVPNQPPSMEVRRLPTNTRDTSPLNLAGSSTLKTTSSNAMPVVAVRGASAQSSNSLTSVTFSSSTLSTPSTSQALVRTVVSPVMPSPPVMVTNAQVNSASPRPPNLSPRPINYPLSGPQPLFAPSEAGPVSAEFSKHAHKLACYMRQAIEDILGDLAKMGNPEAVIKSLRLEVEKLRWEHAQEIAELKHNQDLVVSEIKVSLEKEKMRLVNDVRKQCETEKSRAIEETKRKQWCANCSKEALFYCCWNTSYCDYPCQQTHWPRHMASCAQNNGMPESGNGDSKSSGNRKDGGSGGHRGAAPPPPFHQLQRPGSVPQESHPEEEYYDEDSSSPPTPRTGTSGGTYRVKRRRCGVCKGCLVKDNCGNCAPCRNSKTHQVCRMRRCRSLQSDWSSGGTSRTVSPEPGPTNASLETPPLTHASKKVRSGQKSPKAQSRPLSPEQPGTSSLPPLDSTNVDQHQLGESAKSPVTHETGSSHASQASPYAGIPTSKLTYKSHPKSHHQASALDLLQQKMALPGLPPLHIKPNCPGFPVSCAGDEQSTVAPTYTPANSPQMQLKDLTMAPDNCKNADSIPENCVSQALVPYRTPSEPQLLDPPPIPAIKPTRSRKGHPQRSRNHSPPTRNTYLQPPHFNRQIPNAKDKPFNEDVPEVSLQSQESPLSTQPLLTQPLSTQPLSTQPLSTQPLSTQPLSTQPLLTQPLSTPPLSTQPLLTQPLSTQPLSTQPLSTQPLSTQPLSTHPLSTHPLSTQPLLTQPLSTQPLSTQPLSTQPLSTQPLSTQPLSTQPLSTQPLSTQPLSTQPLSTQPLSTQPLSTQPLSTQPLSTQPLSTQPLSTQPLSTQPLSTQPLSTQPLSTQPLSTQPLSTQPLSTQPLSTQPLSTQPLSTQPLSTQPLSTQPLSTQPLSTQPLSTQPLSTQPLSTQPLSTQPLSTQPLSTQPLSTQPLSTQPLSTQPLSTQPLSTQPLSTQPLSTQPLSTQPLSTQPLSTQPLSTQPLSTQPLSTQPLSTQPLSTHPLSTHPLSTQPLSTQPLSTQPLSTQPLSTQPLSTQPLSTQPLSTQPLSTQPHSTQPLSTQPLSTHPLSTQPLSTQPLSTHPLSTHPLSTHPLSTQPLPSQSYTTMAKNLILPAEKTELQPPTFYPQSPFPLPLPPNHNKLVTSVPLGSGGGQNVSNKSIAPIPNVGSNPQQTSPQHASSYPDVNGYYSHSLQYQRPSEKVIPEAHVSKPFFEMHNSQAYPSSHHQLTPKHHRDARKKGSLPPDQLGKYSNNENSGPSNAASHRLNSNVSFLGSEGHSFNSTQIHENHAALPPSFYPQTTSSHSSAPRSNSQSTNAKPSFLNPHYKSASTPNAPVLPGKYESGLNRNPQNAVGVRSWASDFPLPMQNAHSQPQVNDHAAAQCNACVPNNCSKVPNSMDQLPNFSTTFFNQNVQPESYSQSVTSLQFTGQFTPAKSSKPPRKNARKRAEPKEPSQPHNGPTPYNGPQTLHSGPPTFEFPPESAASIANFCAQLNCPKIGYPQGPPPIPALPAPQSHYPDNGFLQPSNPFPPPRYNSQAHGRRRSHPQSPGGSQQNHHPYDPTRGSCMAILSSTSIIMPPPPPNPPNFLFPPPFDMEMLVRQHQLHRHQLATGLNIFTETLKNVTDPTRKL